MEYAIGSIRDMIDITQKPLRGIFDQKKFLKK